MRSLTARMTANEKKVVINFLLLETELTRVVDTRLVRKSSTDISL